jgi:hypothetical protein
MNPQTADTAPYHGDRTPEVCPEIPNNASLENPDPWFEPHEIPLRIARTRTEVRRLLGILRDHDLRDPLNWSTAGEAIVHLEREVCPVPEVPEYPLPEGVTLRDVVVSAVWRLGDAPEDVDRALLALLDPGHVRKTIERLSRPEVERPAPTPPAHVLEREALWAAWLAEHAGEIEAAEVPMPPPRPEVEVYASVSPDGYVDGMGLDPETAWRRSLEEARDYARRPDTVEDPPADGEALVGAYLRDRALVKVTGPVRAVARLLGGLDGPSLDRVAALASDIEAVRGGAS